MKQIKYGVFVQLRHGREQRVSEWLPDRDSAIASAIEWSNKMKSAEFAVKQFRNTQSSYPLYKNGYCSGHCLGQTLTNEISKRIRYLY